MWQPDFDDSMIQCSSQPRHRDLAVGDIAIHPPQVQALALLMPGHLTDHAGALQLADDEIALGVGVAVGRMGDLEK